MAFASSVLSNTNTTVASGSTSHCSMWFFTINSLSLSPRDRPVRPPRVFDRSQPHACRAVPGLPVISILSEYLYPGSHKANRYEWGSEVKLLENRLRNAADDEHDGRPEAGKIDHILATRDGFEDALRNFPGAREKRPLRQVSRHGRRNKAGADG